MTYTVLWLVLTVAVLAVEAVALFSDSRGTLSAHVWRLTARPVVLRLMLGGWGWLTYHFYFEPRSLTHTRLDDGLAVVAGLAISFLALRLRRPAREALGKE